MIEKTEIENWINNGAEPGKRNIAAYHIAHYYADKGLSYRNTFDMVEKWNKEKNNPPLPLEEIKREVVAVYIR